jgi:phosphoribosylamine---glycine ligase
VTVLPAIGVGTPAHILVVGAGGREHALAWRLGLDPVVERVIVAPGNPGMHDAAATRPDVAPSDLDAIRRLCEREGIDLVVVGPEGPLVDGLADLLTDAGIPVFGPTAGAAAIEGSKATCRDICRAAGIPVAEGAAFSDPGAAIEHVHRLGAPVVVKADGLAGGKGVTVCDSEAEAERAVEDALERRVFGRAGDRVVVERALEGREASVIALCDATTAIALPAARDHKRIDDGDTGPNTGGMGAYSPVNELDGPATARIVDSFHRPALAELASRGRPFRGALFAGLMLTPGGPVLLEFNARFGDPESQALLPRLSVPLAPLLLAAATDRLAAVARSLGVMGSLLPATGDATVAVVLASAGYPSTPRIGDRIDGIEAARAAGALVFAAGVTAGPDGLVTSGGRVVSVVGGGPTVDDAADDAYRAAARITFAGRQMRADIGRGAVAVGGRSQVAVA